MKVLLCFHSMVTRSNHRLAEELSQHSDLELHVLTPDWWPEEARVVHLEKTFDPNYSIRKAPIMYWRQPLPNLFIYRYGLARAIREIQPDILDFYEEPVSLAMGQALFLRRLYAPKSKLLFYSAQNIYKKFPPPFSWFAQWTFRTASAAYVCNSEAGKILRIKGYKGYIHHIPLGVDEEIFKPFGKEERKAVRAEFGLENNQLIVGYVGRLHWEKGLNILLNAMISVPTAQLLLVGDGPHKAEILAKAEANGFVGRIHFVGAVSRLDVPRYLNCMDCLVVPSITRPNWKEQFGRIIVEGFLCEVPVIGSTCGSIPEVIGETGVVVTEGDASALADAINKLLGDVQYSVQLAKKARERALKEFTWEQVAQQRLQMYQNL